MYVFSHSVEFYSVTPWTVAPQAPLCMGLYQQEYWIGMPIPPPGELSNPGIEPSSPALAGGFFTTDVTWNAQTATFGVLIS